MTRFWRLLVAMFAVLMMVLGANSVLPGGSLFGTATAVADDDDGDDGDDDDDGVPVTTDQIIDADGTATPFSGDPAFREVTPGTALDSFPTQGPLFSGLDMFNQDPVDSGWTQGVDDLHSEDPQTCPGAIRDGDHDLGADCKVLDLNGDLQDGEQVDCDLEVGANFTGTVNPCPPTEVKYHDADGDNTWDSGEDLVFDVNNNGVFD